MDAWQILVAVLAAAGGGPGVSKFVQIIRGTRPPPATTVREYRNSDLGQIQFKLAEVYEHQVTQSGTLARIEGAVRGAKSRLDDVDALIDRISETLRDLTQDHRDIRGRVERLEEGPK